jgi:hypothetical protein
MNMEKGRFTVFDSPLNVQRPKPDPGPDNNYTADEVNFDHADPQGLLPKREKGGSSKR